MPLMQGGDVLLVATKIVKYGHACFESDADPDNHDRGYAQTERRQTADRTD